MQIALTAEQERLRLQLREYFTALATPEYQAEMLTAISVYALHRQATLPRR